MSPSMRDAFRQHHRLTDEERAALWVTCTFALDTNVLLNIYRYANSTREDLFKVLKGLGDRVWVLYQVASEFYRRRIEVIQEQHKKYTELQEALDQSLSRLRGGSFRKSAFLRIDQIEGILKPAIEQARGIVDQQREEHPDLLHDDVYLERLVEIIGSKVGEEPDPATRDQRHADAQTRIDQQRPPGYLDAKKNVPERYGDVLIWYELLDRAESTKQPVVFVTDDDKEDWWQIVSGQKLGPRPELREEMRKRANVEFYIYNPAFLLQTAGQQLNLHVSESSVDDAKKVAAELREELQVDVQGIGIQENRITPEQAARELYGNLDKYFYVAQVAKVGEEAVYRWLVSRHTSSNVVRFDRGPFEFLVHQSAGRVAVGVQVIRQRSLGYVRMRVRDASVRAFFELSKGTADDFQLFLVAPDADSALHVARRVLGGPPPEPTFTVSVGFIDEDGMYVEVGRESWGRIG